MRNVEIKKSFFSPFLVDKTENWIVDNRRETLDVDVLIWTVGHE